jgi:hypothetical protein
MSQLELCNVAASATGAQTAVTPHEPADRPRYEPRPTGLFQGSIDATATYELQGRLTTAHDWVVLATYTTDILAEVVLCPHMRVNVSANSGAVLATLEY